MLLCLTGWFAEPGSVLGARDTEIAKTKLLPSRPSQSSGESGKLTNRNKRRHYMQSYHLEFPRSDMKVTLQRQTMLLGVSTGLGRAAIPGAL